MKVLLLNAGYFTGLDGSLSDYLIHGFRYLYTPDAVMHEVENAVKHLVYTEKPDICCFLELHQKTAFVKDFRPYRCHDIDNKYGLQSFLRWLPFFDDNCNGFFSRKNIPFKKLYFKNGAKKLIYELKIAEDVSLILCHFSLSSPVRQKQFLEVQKIIHKRDRVIVAGDFNIFHGTCELSQLLADCDVKLVNHKPTFPAVHPTKMFDLFLCSKSIKITRCEVARGFHGSDHLPVILEFQM